MIHIYYKIVAVCRLLFSTILNYQATSKIRIIEEADISDDFKLVYLSANDLEIAKKDYLSAFGCQMSISQLFHIWIFRKKLCFVLKDHVGDILAYMFLSFNMDEYKANFVHSQAIYVPSKYYNMGYGALLEDAVLSYLLDNTDLAGIAARVSVDNKNAYKLIKYNGFEIVSEYGDPLTGEKRVYVIKKFNRRNDK